MGAWLVAVLDFSLFLWIGYHEKSEGIQFTTTGIGGIVYAMFASWRVALVVLAVTPFISVAAMAVVSLNQSKSTRAAEAYSKAGSVAYSTVSGIKTVLSLNAVSAMIQHYKEATQQALNIATGVLLKQGFANGSMLGSFICLYAVLALYGTALMYREIADNGCDPSGAVPDNQTCESNGADVFGAMLGVAFGKSMELRKERVLRFVVCLFSAHS